MPVKTSELTTEDPHRTERVVEAPPPPPPKRRSLWWLWVILLILAAAAVVWYTQRGPGSAASKQAASGPDGQPAPSGGSKGGRGGRRNAMPSELPVAAAKARTGSIPVYLDGLGSVTAFYTVTVRSRVDGQLMSVGFKEGDFVKAGQVIAEIDPRPYQVMLEQAEGQMARDQALLADARVDLTRYQTLLQQDAIPKQQLDTQVYLVAQYEGNIKQDQSAIDNAKLQLTYAKITAPISGRVGLRLVDPGNIVHAADTTGMLVITQVEPIAVLFTIPEDNLPQVVRKMRTGAGMPVDAYNRDKSVKLSSGRLDTIDNQIDPQTGTARLKAIFQNRDNMLWPNQFVNARMLVDTLTNQVLIPQVAIQRGQQGTFVYVIKPDNTVEVRTIQVGVMEGEDADVLGGLKAGETVVTDGTDRLQAGSKVRIRPAGGGAGAGSGAPASGRRRGQGGKAATSTTSTPSPAEKQP